MPFFQSIVPEKPVQRVVSLAALAAAGCGGLYFAAESGALASWGLPFFKPWQVLTVTSFGINAFAVSMGGGRLDTRSSQEKNAPTEGATKDEPLPAHRYFVPASWAFAIWGPIFLGETALSIYQALPLDSVNASAGWLSHLSPWLSAAFLFQSYWCLSFRKWARDAGLLWFPAVLLGCTAGCLGRAHNVLRGALAAGNMSSLQYLLVHLPVSLHFGWVSCATLVNLNNYVSLVPSFSKKVMLRFSLASAAAAVALAVAVTVQTGDPVYAGVVSWALSAVASHNSKKASSASEKTPNSDPPASTVTPLLVAGSKEQEKDSSLATEAVVAKIGSVVCAITAVATPLVLKKLKGD